jgi:hypothetical protein
LPIASKEAHTRTKTTQDIQTPHSTPKTRTQSIKMENTKVIYNGQEFESEIALHEWRLIFEFDYFLEEGHSINEKINKLLNK